VVASRLVNDADADDDHQRLGLTRQTTQPASPHTLADA
jgi:hypothetical protein